jgi:hypothetical protein
MKKQVFPGAIAGVCLTELLQYFAPDFAVLFYCYVLADAVLASILGGTVIGGATIAAYVVAWKMVGMLYLAQAYGLAAIARGFSPFLFDWILVFLVGVVGGYAGTAVGKYFVIYRNRAQKV